MTDPIADMLTRIRNAQMVKKSEVVMPYSKLKFNILNLMVREGWLASAEKIEPDNAKAKKEETTRFTTLKVAIKYNSDKTPKITSLKRISKPGQRIYVNKNVIPIVLNGRGMSVISSSIGIITDSEARKKKVGGEVICEIY